MTNDEKPKNAEDPDLMTDLLRQMGLCEEEIGAALNLAENIEKKIESNSTSAIEAIPLKLTDLSKDELIKTIENLKSELDHFNNIVAVQFIMLIKKYKDRVISLENKIRQKNAQIQQLSQQIEFLRK